MSAQEETEPSTVSPEEPQDLAAELLNSVKAVARKYGPQPRIVTPEEAQEAWDRWRSGLTAQVYMHGVDLAHTVATEPDRTRAAVVRALLSAGREVAEDMNLVSYENGLTIEKFMERRAGAIENGADW